MARFKINALNVADMGVGILMNINIPTQYKNAVQAILSGFKAGNEYEFNPYKAKRSLKANAYFWKLADELATVLNTTKENIYKQAIYHVGRYQILEAKDEETAKSFCKKWCMNGLGWYAYQDKVMPKTIYMYYGSSVYNSSEMARVIDFVQDACKQQGIEVRPKEEVEAMLKEWSKEHG